jgi:uncharacterized protein YjbI with pentapeptide repeats
MDDERFDALSRTLGNAASRRGVLGLLAGIAGLGMDAGAARRHHRARGAGVQAQAACANPGPGKNLDGCDFSGQDFSGRSLRGSSLRGTRFTDAILRGTNLSDSNAKGANFHNANLCGANLSASTLKEADFTDATLTRADLHASSCGGADFTGAIFCRTRGCNGQLINPSCTGCCADADCSGGDVCVDGACVPPSCPGCVDGTCQTGDQWGQCGANGVTCAACAVGQTCAAATHTCTACATQSGLTVCNVDDPDAACGVYCFCAEKNQGGSFCYETAVCNGVTLACTVDSDCGAGNACVKAGPCFTCVGDTMCAKPCLEGTRSARTRVRGPRVSDRA